MKLNVKEILTEVDNQRPINSTTVGICHPNTFNVLFPELKDSFIKEDLMFMESEAVKENHILLVSTIKDSEVTINDIVYPSIQVSDIPLVCE